MAWVTYRRGRGMGQTIWDIPIPELGPEYWTTQPPAILQQPLVTSVPAPPATGIVGWLQQNQVIVFAAAGTLLLLALAKGKR